VSGVVQLSVLFKRSRMGWLWWQDARVAKALVWRMAC